MPLLSTANSQEEINKLLADNPKLVERVKQLVNPLDYRSPYWITFGEGDKRWAAPNPAAAADASCASAYVYLVKTCPDTKTAIAKLRAIRAAVKAARVRNP